MLERIIELDIELLIYLNNLGSGTWDSFWLFMTYTITSVPIYLFVLYLVYRYFGLKKLVFTLLVVVLVIAISDQLSNIFKFGFERLRPCYNEDIKNLIRHVKPSCGGRFSFFSAHASTSLSVAVFFSLILRNHLKYFSCFLILWAILVGYSRIYIGVHFPVDVLFGFMVGIINGALMYKVRKYFSTKYFS
jgi:undecaprenyl-diphosphatase